VAGLPAHLPSHLV